METNNKSMQGKSPLYIIFSITLMAVLGVSSITPAFPDIIEHFHLQPEQVGWLITIFTLPGIFLTPVLGILADRVGRKKILVPSLFLFGFAGTGCALTGSYEMLLLLRFFQGIGAASLGSLNVTLIGDLFQGKERVRVMGLNASVLSIGTASYPTIGGLLATIGWNYPFLLPSIAFLVGFWVILKLDNPEPKKGQAFKEYIATAFAYIFKKDVLILFFMSFFTFILLYGAYLTFFPLLLKQNFNFHAGSIGLTMSLASASTAITSANLKKIRHFLTEKQCVMLAFLFYSLSMLLLYLAKDLSLVYIGIIFFGIGHGINFPVIQVLLTSAVPLEYRAAFMSMNGTILRMGQSAGPMVMGLIFAIMGGLGSVFAAGSILAILIAMAFRLLFNSDAMKNNAAA